MEFLFRNGFQTKYIISAAAEEHKDAFLKKGYEPMRCVNENDTVRNLYRDVAPEDTLSFLAGRAIRSMMLEKNI